MCLCVHMCESVCECHVYAVPLEPERVSDPLVLDYSCELPDRRWELTWVPCKSSVSIPEGSFSMSWELTLKGRTEIKLL